MKRTYISITGRGLEDLAPKVGGKDFCEPPQGDYIGGIQWASFQKGTYAPLRRSLPR